MRKYEVTITGTTPLLMHWDNIEWADKLSAWRVDPANKAKSKAGDDRTPAWTWIGSMYHDNIHVGMPSDNLMRCLMEGGAMVPVPGAKGNKTFKSQTQSGMMVDQPQWDLLDSGAAIPMSEVTPLLAVDDFAIHKQTCSRLGFRLHVKRAKIGQSKHIRVRPAFDRWTLIGTVSVWDEQITTRVLNDTLTYAGQYKGLGDWRPGGKTPGAFGMFSATTREVF